MLTSHKTSGDSVLSGIHKKIHSKFQGHPKNAIPIGHRRCIGIAHAMGWIRSQNEVEEALAQLSAPTRPSFAKHVRHLKIAELREFDDEMDVLRGAAWHAAEMMRIADKLTINHLLSTEEIREFLVSTNSKPDALSIGAEVDYQNHVKYPYADFAKWLLDDAEDDGKTQLHRFGHLTLEQLESAYTTFKSDRH